MFITVFLFFHFLKLDATTNKALDRKTLSAPTFSTIAPHSSIDSIDPTSLQTEEEETEKIILTQNEKEKLEKLAFYIKKKDIKKVKGLSRVIKPEISSHRILEFFIQKHLQGENPLYHILSNHSVAIFNAIKPCFLKKDLTTLLALKIEIKKNEKENSTRPQQLSLLQIALQSRHTDLIQNVLESIDKNHLTKECIQQFKMPLDECYHNIIHLCILKRNQPSIKSITKTLINILPQTTLCSLLTAPDSKGTPLILIPLLTKEPDYNYFMTWIFECDQQTVQHILSIKTFPIPPKQTQDNTTQTENDAQENKQTDDPSPVNQTTVDNTTQTKNDTQENKQTYDKTTQTEFTYQIKSIHTKTTKDQETQTENDTLENKQTPNEQPYQEPQINFLHLLIFKKDLTTIQQLSKLLPQEIFNSLLKDVDEKSNPIIFEPILSSEPDYDFFFSLSTLCDLETLQHLFKQKTFPTPSRSPFRCKPFIPPIHLIVDQCQLKHLQKLQEITSKSFFTKLMSTNGAFFMALNRADLTSKNTLTFFKQTLLTLSTEIPLESAKKKKRKKTSDNPLTPLKEKYMTELNNPKVSEENLLKMLQSQTRSGRSILKYMINYNSVDCLDALPFNETLCQYLLPHLIDIATRVSPRYDKKKNDKNEPETTPLTSQELFIQLFLQKIAESDSQKNDAQKVAFANTANSLTEREEEHQTTTLTEQPNLLIKALSFKSKNEDIDLMQLIIQKGRFDFLPDASLMSVKQIQFILTQIVDKNNFPKTAITQNFIQQSQIIFTMTHEQLQYFKPSLNEELFHEAILTEKHTFIAYFLTCISRESMLEFLKNENQTSLLHLIIEKRNKKIFRFLLSDYPEEVTPLLIKRTPYLSKPEPSSPLEQIFEENLNEFLKIITHSTIEINDLFRQLKTQYEENYLRFFVIEIERKSPNDMTLLLLENYTQLLKDCPYIFYDSYKQDKNLFDFFLTYIKSSRSLRNFFFKSPSYFSLYEINIILPAINAPLSNSLTSLLNQVFQKFEQEPDKALYLLYSEEILKLDPEKIFAFFSQINPKTGLTLFQTIVNQKNYSLLSGIKSTYFKKNQNNWEKLVTQQIQLTPKQLFLLSKKVSLTTSIHIAMDLEETKILTFLLESISPNNIQPLLQIPSHQQEPLLQKSIQHKQPHMFNYILNHSELLISNLTMIFELILNNPDKFADFMKKVLSITNEQPPNTDNIFVQLITLKDNENRTLLDSFYQKYFEPFIPHFFDNLTNSQLIELLPYLQQESLIEIICSKLNITKEINFQPDFIFRIFKSNNAILIKKTITLLVDNLTTIDLKEKSLKILIDILTYKDKDHLSFISLCQQQQLIDDIHTLILPYKKMVIIKLYESNCFNQETVSFLFQNSKDILNYIILLFHSVESNSEKKLLFTNLFISTIKKLSSKDDLLIHKVLKLNNEEGDNILSLMIAHNQAHLTSELLSIIQTKEDVYRILISKVISKQSAIETMIDHGHFHFLSVFFKYCTQEDKVNLLFSPYESDVLLTCMCYHKDTSFEVLSSLTSAEIKNIFCFIPPGSQYRALDAVCSIPNIKALIFLLKKLSVTQFSELISSSCQNKPYYSLACAFHQQHVNVFKTIFEYWLKKDLKIAQTHICNFIDKVLSNPGFQSTPDSHPVLKFMNEFVNKHKINIYDEPTPRPIPQQKKDKVAQIKADTLQEKVSWFIHQHPRNGHSLIEFIENEQSRHLKSKKKDKILSSIFSSILSQPAQLSLTNGLILTDKINLLALAIESDKEEMAHQILNIYLDLKSKNIPNLPNIFFPDKENPHLSPFWKATEKKNLDLLKLFLKHCDLEDFKQWVTQFASFPNHVFQTSALIASTKVSIDIFNLFLSQLDDEKIIPFFTLQQKFPLSELFSQKHLQISQVPKSTILDGRIRSVLYHIFQDELPLTDDELIYKAIEADLIYGIPPYTLLFNLGSKEVLESILLKLNFWKRSSLLHSIFESAITTDRPSGFMQVCPIHKVLYSATEAFAPFFSAYLPQKFQEVFQLDSKTNIARVKEEMQLAEAFDNRDFKTFVNIIYTNRLTPIFRNQNPILLLFKNPNTRAHSLTLLKEFHEQRESAPLIYEKVLLDAIGQDTKSTLQFIKFFDWPKKTSHQRTKRDEFKAFLNKELKPLNDLVETPESNPPIYIPPQQNLISYIKSA